MSHAENKVRWCLDKAQKELKENGKHRGLLKVESDLKRAEEYVKKAEHFLRATEYLKKGNYSDISTSTIFYSMYHCLLAISCKFGYESRNQECTIALIRHLIEEGKISFEISLLDKISSMNGNDPDNEKTSMEIREQYQYGVQLSIKDDIYEELLETAKKIIMATKVILKEQ